MCCKSGLNRGQSAHGFHFRADRAGVSLTADCLVVRAPQRGSGVGRTVLGEPRVASTQRGSGSFSFEGTNPRARLHLQFSRRFGESGGLALPFGWEEPS
jgi:hypothetical protein